MQLLQYLRIVERGPHLFLRRRDALAVVHLHDSVPYLVTADLARALAAAALDGDLGEDRHRDLLGRDGAEIEARPAP